MGEPILLLDGICIRKPRCETQLILALWTSQQYYSRPRTKAHRTYAIRMVGTLMDCGTCAVSLRPATMRSCDESLDNSGLIQEQLFGRMENKQASLGVP